MFQRFLNRLLITVFFCALSEVAFALPVDSKQDFSTLLEMDIEQMLDMEVYTVSWLVTKVRETQTVVYRKDAEGKYVLAKLSFSEWIVM